MFRRISDTLLRWKLTMLSAGFVVCLMAIFAANDTLFGKVLALKGAATQSASTSSAPGDWVSATPMPSTRNFAAASVLPSGNWLVVGGFRTGQNFLTDAAIYKPATNTWQTVGAIPTAHRYTAQLLATGDVLVAGDDDNTAPSATSYLFTETATGGAWAATSGQPSIKRYQTTLSLLTTGTMAGNVLMTGGYDNNCCSGASGTFKTTELYNPTTKTWSAGPAMNVGRAFHTATVLPNGQVLVVGGFQRDPLQAFDSVERYTPGGGWALQTTKLATARYAHTATLLPSGEVLVVGGTNSTTALNSIELYNPSTSQWTTKAPMTTARQLHTATLLPSGKVLVAGGLGANGQPTNSAELYDPANNTWSDAGPLVNARGRHVAALLSCGKVIIAGGNGTAGDLNTSETYTQKDPLITLTPPTLTNGIVGQTFTQQFSPAGGAAPFTYSLSSGTLPKGVTLQPDGKLTGIPEVAGSSTFTVTATDKNGCTGNVTLTWQTVCPNIVISPTTLHDGIAGQSYSPVEQLTSTGGTAPYSYAVTAGLLPSGMQLTSDGKLQGTPLQTGGFSFTVTVTDKFGCTGMRVYGLTINCGITAITPDVMQLPDAIRGATYAPTGLQFSTVGGCGMNTFTISAGQLPLGLTLNPNGTFSGAPVLTGDFTFTVKVTDQCSCMATREYKLKVICATKNCGCVGPPPPRNDALISWWPMDGNGNDIRGTHHAQTKGTGGTFPPAIVDQGILTTANHWLEVPHDLDNPTVFNVNQFTLDAWININQFNTSNMP
ncbi:MAG: putative Ig domain-containing protein, partial [Acidobacteria bacterium]|nr:putative Ig domain-containing protein [Acidobacteriota bacterium]